MSKQDVNGTRLALAAIALGTLVGPLDSAVNISFSDITSSFGIPVKSIRWIIIPYVATYASLMLVFGRLGDLFGHIKIFRMGLVVSVIAYGFCGLAETFEWLMAFRVMQGIGTAMVFSCGPALATSLFDESVRSRILGGYAMIYGLGVALGPSLGGIMVQYWGWPSVFLFRVPVAILALLLISLGRFPTLPRDEGVFETGLILRVAFCAAIALIGVGQFPYLLDNTLWAGLVGVGTGVALYIAILSARRGGMFGLTGDAVRKPDFVIVICTGAVVNFTGFSVMLLVPYFLVQPSAPVLAAGGLILATGPLGMMIAAQWGGFLTTRFGANRLAFLGAVLVAGGTLSIGFWPSKISIDLMVVSLLVYGTGLGLFQVSSLELVSAALPQSQRGVAGSIVLVMRTVGVLLAASLLMLLFSVNVESAVGTSNAFLSGFQETFRLAAAVLFIFLSLTWLRPRIWIQKS
ncbi:MFS transporter [Alphaproteobacteria bacterium]|nr:MFS transporter [Alphaproteobacteria bacterium]